MCGIFGYIGDKKSSGSIVFSGLKILEYRGYDSWGVAQVFGDKIELVKHVGKIGTKKIPLIKSDIAIGHTRWATHGGVTVANAHPHLDCNKAIALVHNGIVENYEEIKKSLEKKKHIFVSETDSEAVVHLIEEYNKSHTLIESVRLACKDLTGLNAIVVLDKTSNEIIAFRNGSPLVVGIKAKELFVASDPIGILPHTNELLFLNDGELVSLKRDGEIELFDCKSNKSLKIQTEKVAWENKQSEKGTYKHFMLKEIFDQEKILKSIAISSISGHAIIAESIQRARGTFFIGAGTAYYACMAGAYLFAKIAKKHVNHSQASEFGYLEDFVTERSLFIALSQSGETIDVIEPLQRVKKKGATTVGIVNNIGSTIYRMTDEKLLLGAGPELAVASTKAYTAKLATLFLISHILAGTDGRGRKELLLASIEIRRILSAKNLTTIKRIAKFLTKASNIYVIGRGLSYPSSLEAALKIKEVSNIPTEGFAGGELKHGTIALIENMTPCIVFAPMDETYDAVIANAMEIKSRGGYIIGVSPKNNSVFSDWIEVKDCLGATIIAQIVPIQLIAYYMALIRKLDPDKPRNLAKSVTVK